MPNPCRKWLDVALLIGLIGIFVGGVLVVVAEACRLIGLFP